MSLKGGRSIYKAKGHDFVFKTSNTSPKRSKVFVFLYSHLNPIKSMANINFHKELSPYDLSKCFLNKRERVSILLCNSIQLPIVDIET